MSELASVGSTLSLKHQSFIHQSSLVTLLRSPCRFIPPSPSPFPTSTELMEEAPRSRPPTPGPSHGPISTVLDRLLPNATHSRLQDHEGGFVAWPAGDGAAEEGAEADRGTGWGKYHSYLIYIRSVEGSCNLFVFMFVSCGGARCLPGSPY
jgi:hypothetical protein